MDANENGDGSKPTSETISTGTVIEDLATTIEVGANLTFANERFRFDYEGPPVGLENWAILKGAILAVHIGDEAGHQIEGSGVCCQSKGNSSPLRRISPQPTLALGHDCPPLGEGFRASLLVDVAADEMALLVEEVVD